MRALVVTLAVAALAFGTLSACKEQTDKAQADISKGNPEGGISRKKVEAAAKEGEEQRRKAIDGEK
jgi:hypothetical protein